MKKHPTLLILASMLSLLIGCATNPITGETELMLLSEDQDVELGKTYAPEIEKQLGGKIPDPALQDYINAIGQKIARVSHNQNFKYQFVALQDKTVNAFALPGGYVYITKGMLQNLTTESQLAAILAHEVVHIVARDIANAMSKQIGMELLLSAVTSEQTSQSLLTVAQLGGQIISLRFSRQDEREADLGGVEYMVAAGYNPYGMAEAMQMLTEQSKSRPIEFLSTHPSPENRVAYIRKKIAPPQSSLQNAIIGKEQYRNTVLNRLN